jgi:hypothetical protein
MPAFSFLHKTQYLSSAKPISMKKFLIAFLLITAVTLSCRKPQEVPTMTSVLLQSEWKVGYLRDNSTNYTSLYTNWRFTFKADSTVLITNGSTQLSGRWSEDVNRKKFDLTVNAPTLQGALLSREWDIVLIGPNRIKLANDKFFPTQELYFDKP